MAIPDVKTSGRCRKSYGDPDGQRLNGFRYIMHPYDGGAHLDPGQRSRQACRQATLNRLTGDGPQHGLARHTHQHRGH